MMIKGKLKSIVIVLKYGQKIYRIFQHSIYFGYNGSNKFNPSRNTLKPELQSLIDNKKSLAANDLSNPYAARNSYELWSVDNCAEVYATNNALRNGADIENIFLNTKYFNDGTYA